MSVKIGIVGLPNVGKSTLFNAITNSSVEAANYPFATIEPNVGVVYIKDKRVDDLQKIFDSKKKIYNQIVFTDIAGLVKGASKGEGLGNKFLANIRECDSIVHVVRLFENSDIVHVESNLNPKRDIEIINIELILSDIEQIQKWMEKNRKRSSMSLDESELFIFNTLNKAIELLKQEIKLEDFQWTKNEIDVLKTFSLLTLKPTIYLLNIAEDELSNPEINPYLKEVNELLISKNIVIISTQIEYEISKLDDDNQNAFLEDLGLKQSGLNLLSQKAFQILGLETFFTCGPQEIHSWSFKKGTLAPQTAGIIHTDFEKGFIKAEVYNYSDLIKYGSESLLKEKGLIRIEGKEYKVNDGDIIHFRFNV